MHVVYTDVENDISDCIEPPPITNGSYSALSADIVSEGNLDPEGER